MTSDSIIPRKLPQEEVDRQISRLRRIASRRDIVYVAQLSVVVGIWITVGIVTDLAADHFSVLMILLALFCFPLVLRGIIFSDDFAPQCKCPCCDAMLKYYASRGIVPDLYKDACPHCGASFPPWRGDFRDFRAALKKDEQSVPAENDDHRLWR